MSNDITINQYVDKIMKETNKFLKTFTKMKKVNNVGSLIIMIDSMYPFIMVTCMNDIYKISQLDVTNEQIMDKAKIIFDGTDSLNDCGGQYFMSVPILHIKKLGYDLLIEKYRIDKSIFHYQVQKDKLFILEIIHDLVFQSYEFFDSHSSNTLIYLMNNTMVIDNSNYVIGLFLNKNNKCDRTIKKLKYVLEAIDENINNNLLNCDESDSFDGEGYCTLIIMALLLCSKNTIYNEEYGQITKWFKKNKKKLGDKNNKYNIKTRKATSSEYKLFFNCCMAFFVMEDTYNRFFEIDCYNTDKWT